MRPRPANPRGSKWDQFVHPISDGRWVVAKRAGMTWLVPRRRRPARGRDMFDRIREMGRFVHVRDLDRIADLAECCGPYKDRYTAEHFAREFFPLGTETC